VRSGAPLCPCSDRVCGAHQHALISPLQIKGRRLRDIHFYRMSAQAEKEKRSNPVEQVAETIAISLVAAAVANGFGHHSYYLTTEDKETIGRCIFGVFLVGWWASCFGRVSVACVLLPLTTSLPWKIILWANIGSQLVLLTWAEIFELIQCQPLRAVWETVPDAKCFSTEEMWQAAYASIGELGWNVFNSANAKPSDRYCHD
jgi:hypothetical protein